jgi:hypothetical protein
VIGGVLAFEVWFFFIAGSPFGTSRGANKDDRAAKIR